MASGLFSFVSTAIPATWQTSGEWVIKNGGTFFPIGICLEANAYDDSLEIASFTHFNTIYVDNPRDATSVMNSKTVLVDQYFRWKLRGDPEGGYHNELIRLGYDNDDEYISYDEMNVLKNICVYNDFKKFLRYQVVAPICNSMAIKGIDDFIIYMVDEPDHGDGSSIHWCFYPEIIESYHEQIRAHSDSTMYGENNLAAIGYGPIGENRYLWEINHGSPDPAIPPYGSKYKCSFDGGPFSLDKGYENVKRTASYYKATTSIHMLNDYNAFFNSPVYAAAAVDGIRDGIAAAPNPVWLWFDIRDMDDDTSASKVRCQVYTSITRRCTGVFFYGLDDIGKTRTETNLEYAKSLATELDGIHHLLESGVQSNGIAHGHVFSWEPSPVSIGPCIYWSIFNYLGESYALLVNTSNEAPCFVDDAEIPGFDAPGDYIELTGRYEVDIIQEQTGQSIFSR